MTNKTRGFTLIELLVVVIIIAVLTAIAVPQYKLAVMKSQYAMLKPIVHSVAKAEEAYYLANGTYTNQFDELDIDMPGGKSGSSTKSAYRYDWGICWIDSNSAGVASSISCQRNSLSVTYKQYFSNKHRACVTGLPDENPFENKLCKIETKRTGPYLGSNYSEWTY